MMCLAPEIVPVCPSLLQIESEGFRWCIRAQHHYSIGNFTGNHHLGTQFLTRASKKTSIVSNLQACSVYFTLLSSEYAGHTAYHIMSELSVWTGCANLPQFETCTSIARDCSNRTVLINEGILSFRILRFRTVMRSTNVWWAHAIQHHQVQYEVWSYRYMCLSKWCQLIKMSFYWQPNNLSLAKRSHSE